MPINTDARKKQIIDMLVEARRAGENQKYGEFVLQTNKVQWKLAAVILLHSKLLDKQYAERMFEETLGSLIQLFQSCGPKDSRNLLESLKRYNKKRKSVAHYMYSSKRLTISECETAIEEGRGILRSLNKLIQPFFPDIAKE